MKKYNISANLIRVIKNLYDKATSAVLFNSSRGDWFRKTVGVRQGCLHSLSLFNIFLERITTDALEGHKGTVSIGGRTVTNLRFADVIDGLAGEEEEPAKLADPQPTPWRSVPRGPSWCKQHQWHQHRGQRKWIEARDWHKIQIPGLSYNCWGFQARDSTDNSSTDKVETSLEWQEYFFQLQDTTDALVTSIFLYACESWILTAELQKGTQRGRDGKTTSGNGQAWNSPTPRGQWRTGENGGNWLRSHMVPQRPSWLRDRWEMMRDECRPIHFFFIHL